MCRSHVVPVPGLLSCRSWKAPSCNLASPTLLTLRDSEVVEVGGKRT